MAGQGTPTACVPEAVGGGPAVFGASCVSRDWQSVWLHRKDLLNERVPEHTSPENRGLQSREDGRECARPRRSVPRRGERASQATDRGALCPRGRVQRSRRLGG